MPVRQNECNDMYGKAVIGRLTRYRGGEMSTETYDVRDSPLQRTYPFSVLRILVPRKGEPSSGKLSNMSFTAIEYGHLTFSSGPPGKDNPKNLLQTFQE